MHRGSGFRGCCDAALEEDPASAKARYRKATALLKLKEPDRARAALKPALDADPAAKELLALDKQLERAQLLEKKKAQKVFGKMFG